MLKPFNLIMLLLLCFFSLGGQAQQLFVINGLTQGTDYSIKYYAEEPLLLQREVDSLLNEIDISMSLYRPDSRISKFNQTEADLQLDQHLYKVLKKSFQVYNHTKGKFDITVAPLVEIWGFGVKPIQSYPDSASIKMILSQVGMNKLELTDRFLKRRQSGVQIDLNGIAQGYTVDLISDFMIQKGIKAFVTEIGGEIRIYGRKPGGEGFRVGVEGPAEAGKKEPFIKHVISFQNGAVTTSGNYRKYLEIGDHKISHLIDPITGYPLETSLISVTLFAEDALTADGYDNAIMAMEPLAALNFIRKIPGMEVYFIYQSADGKVEEMMSDGFKKMIIN